MGQRRQCRQSPFLLGSRGADASRLSEDPSCQESQSQKGYQCHYDGPVVRPAGPGSSPSGGPGHTDRRTPRSRTWKAAWCSKDARLIQCHRGTTLFDESSGKEGSCFGGSPSKVNGSISRSWEKPCGDAGGRAEGMERGSRHVWRPSSTCYIAARISTDSAGRPLGLVKFRPDERPVRNSLIQPQYFYQRRAAKREVAERASGGDQQLLLVAAPTITSKDVPQPCHPKDRGGVPKCQSEFPPVLRAVRGIPQPERNGADPMVIGVRARLPHPGRRAKSPRAPSSNHSLFGTDRNRWRLDHRLFVSTSRRTTDPIVPGEGPEPSHPGPTICTIGSAVPCRGSSSLPEGTRDIEFPEEGNPEPFQSKGIPKHRIPSFTKEAAEVSQETESPSSQFPVKPACAGPVPMELDTGSGLSEFRDCADHPGCSASNKKISHRGLGTGVDFETEMTHSKWCGMLTSMVLRSRSPFAFYQQKTFRLSRSTTTSATTLFPIPVPFVGLFDRMSPTQAVRDRRTQNVQRVVYIIVYALNYWYFGGPPPDLSLLGRVPNPTQCRIYRRIENFVRSDSGMPSFRVAAAGRRFPQLVARVCELTESMTRLGLGGDIYTKSFAGVEPDFNPEEIPELQPYRDLQTSRLTLYGRAHWDITSYLTDELIMPFREPKSLLVGRHSMQGPLPRDPGSLKTMGQPSSTAPP